MPSNASARPNSTESALGGLSGVYRDVACRVAILSVPRCDAMRTASSIALCCRESHFFQLARLAIASSVGAVPSNASARPNSTESAPIPLPASVPLPAPSTL